MAELKTSESWGVGDLRPSVTQRIFSGESSSWKDLTGATDIKFYLELVSDGSMKIDGEAGGTGDLPNGLLQYDWKDTDTDTLGEYRGYFTFILGGGQQSSTSFEVLIENQANRRF